MQPLEEKRPSVKKGRQQGWNRIMRQLTKRGGNSHQYGFLEARGKRYNPLLFSPITTQLTGM